MATDYGGTIGASQEGPGGRKEIDTEPMRTVQRAMSHSP